MKCKLAILFSLFFSGSISSYSQNMSAEVEFATLLSQSEISLLKGDLSAAVANLRKSLTINPNSSVANYQLARIYSNLHDIDAALNYGLKAYKLKPENTFYSDFLSTIYFEIGDEKNFLKFKELSFPENSTYEQYSYYIEMLLSISPNSCFHEKLSLLDKMENLFGYDNYIGTVRAAVFEKSNDKNNAEVEYIRLSRIDSTDLRPLYNLKNFYERQGKAAKVQEVQNLIQSKNTKNISGYLDDNFMYLSSGKKDLFYQNLIESLKNDESYDLSEKLHHLNKILQLPVQLNYDSLSIAFEVLCETYNTAVSPYLNYSSFLMMNNNYDKTVEVLKSALEIDKSKFEIWIRLFKVLTISEEYSDLLDITNNAAEYFPEMSEVYLYNAVANLYLGKFSDAKSSFDLANDMGIDLSNSYPNYLFYTAVYKYYSKESDANEFFQKFQQYNPDDYYLQLQYAYFIIDDGKNLNHAESIINHYSNDLNLNYYFYFVRAYLHLKNNNLEQSRDDIQQAINMDSSKYHVYNLAGDIFAASGDCTNAIVYWNQAIDRGGNSSLISSKIQKCKK